jgi:glutathione synthase/RimK-type ligase-like ATP-grasp enzyme
MSKKRKAKKSNGMPSQRPNRAQGQPTKRTVPVFTTPVAEVADQLYAKAVKEQDPKSRLAITEELIKLSPTHLKGLGLRAETLIALRQYDAASDLFKNLCILQPDNLNLLVGYVVNASKSGRLHDALCAAQRLVLLKPDKVFSLELLAGLYGNLQMEEMNRYWAGESAKLQPTVDHPSKGSQKIKVLVLNTKKSGTFNYNPENNTFKSREGHNNLGSMLDSKHIARTTFWVDVLEDDPMFYKKLKGFDIIYNGITDADRCKDALMLSESFCQEISGIPVLNHPERILKTTREENYNKFKDIDDIVFPKSYCLGLMQGNIAEEIKEKIKFHDFELPVIVRASGFQGGKNMHVIDNLDNLEIRLNKPSEVYMIQYHDVSFVDQRIKEDNARIYPKYRAFLVDGELYPAHFFATLNDFNVRRVKYYEVLKTNPWLDEIQDDYLNNPEGHLPSGMWRKLEEVGRSIGLDYLGIDFAIREKSGGGQEIIVFEANASMRNMMNDQSKDHPVYKSYYEITMAVNRMFANKARIPAWEFDVPDES